MTRVEFALNQLRILVRHPLQFLAVLLLGGVASFVYSFGPLHNAERWQIDHLETRLDDRNRAVTELEKELGTLQRESSTRPDPARFAAAESELKDAKGQTEKLESQVRRHERTIRSLRRAVDEWKAKAAKSADALAAAKALTPPEPAPAPPASGEPDDPVLAAERALEAAEAGSAQSAQGPDEELAPAAPAP